MQYRHLLALALGMIILGMLGAPTYAAAGGWTTPTTIIDCPSANGILSAVYSPPAGMSASWTNVGNLYKYSIAIPATPTTNGIIEFCVYPADGSGNPTGSPMPTGTTETTAVTDWTAGPDCGGTTLAHADCIHAIRNHGYSNIPYGSGTVEVLDVTWGTVPAGFYLAAHILDSAICGAGGTCFVALTPSTPPPGSSGLTTGPIVDEGPGSLVGTSPPTAYVGDSLHDTATLTVSGDSGANPTGTVTYHWYYTSDDCTGPYYSATVDVGGTAASPTVGDSPSTGPLGIGINSFMAVYTGDGNYAGSSSACEPFHIVHNPLTAPEFPLGSAMMFAVLAPVLLLLRKKIVPLN